MNTTALTINVEKAANASAYLADSRFFRPARELRPRKRMPFVDMLLSRWVGGKADAFAKKIVEIAGLARDARRSGSYHDLLELMRETRDYLAEAEPMLCLMAHLKGSERWRKCHPEVDLEPLHLAHSRVLGMITDNKTNPDFKPIYEALRAQPDYGFESILARVETGYDVAMLEVTLHDRFAAPFIRKVGAPWLK